MMMAYLAGRRDPFDDEDVALKFGDGHPALEYLSGVRFDWPKTYIAGGDGSFVTELPAVSYMREWGGPSSGERLLKTANSIAAFCRDEKRKSRPSEEAVSDWEDDLGG